MGEPLLETYRRDLSERLTGSARARQRLLSEIQHHIEDAISAQLANGVDADEAEAVALERLGPPHALARAWEDRCRRQQTRQRTRLGLVAVATAAASVLALTQHAEGRDDLTTPTQRPWVDTGVEILRGYFRGDPKPGRVTWGTVPKKRWVTIVFGQIETCVACRGPAGSVVKGQRATITWDANSRGSVFRISIR